MFPKEKNQTSLKIILLTSTFTSENQNKVPMFVEEQVIFLKKKYPEMEFSVLAPHFQGTKNYQVKKHYSEYRFHYFWPHSFETLAGRGIVPALKENKLRYFLIPFFFWFQFRALLELTRKIQPDLIYAHWFTPQGINAGIVSVITGIPFAFVNHASDVFILKKIPWLGGIVVRYFSKRAKAITTSAKCTLERFKFFYNNEEEFKKVNIKIIPMGIDYSKFDQVSLNKAELKERYNIGEQIVLLFIGRLVDRKGIVDLLRAFHLLKNQHPGLILLIAGEGQQRAKFEQEAANLKISNQVIFTGFISGRKKTDFLHMADILIIPSIITKGGHAEGLPVVLMEGLAVGKLVVATYESSAGEIITNGENGFLVKQKDPKAIAKAVDRIMQMEQTRKNEIISRAKESAKAFDWNKIVKRHYDFVFDKPDPQL